MLPVATQLDAAASEPEVYRFVMQSLHYFEHAVATKLMQGVAGRETCGGAEPTGAGACGPGPQDLADAMVSVWHSIDFGPLEEIVDR